MNIFPFVASQFDTEENIKPDRNLRDFHLRRPILPQDDKHLNRNVVLDLKAIESLYPYQGLIHDPNYTIAKILTEIPSIKRFNINSCVMPMSTTVQKNLCQVVETIFGQESKLHYQMILDSLNSEPNHQVISKYKFLGFLLESAITKLNSDHYHDIQSEDLPFLNNQEGCEIITIPRHGQCISIKIHLNGRIVTLLFTGSTMGIVNLIPSHILYLNHDESLMLQDICLSRWLCLTVCSIPDMFSGCCLPISQDLQRIYHIGDRIINKTGSKGFSLLKFFEPLCIGRIQALADGKKGDFRADTFWNTTIDDYRELARELNITELAEDFVRPISLDHNTSRLIQLYGIYRHWGHPVIDAEAGLFQLRTKAQKVTTVYQPLIWELVNDLQKQLIHNHYKKYQLWPPGSKISESMSPTMKHCIDENRWPTREESILIEHSWQYVKYNRIFDLPDAIPLNLIFQDKAHSRNLADLRKILQTSKDPRINITLKLLVTVLENSSIDVIQFLHIINRDGLPLDQLVIGLKAKEREMKVQGRFFSLMTLALRMYFVATEWLIAKFILPIFPEITMADNFVSLQKKIYSVTRRQRIAEAKSLNFIISLDYEKWNTFQRHGSTYDIFHVIDQSFGWESVISRTHTFFSNSIIYYADQPHKLNKNMSPDNHYIWTNHLGGLEGLRQKGWTVIGVLLLRKVAKGHSVDMKVLAQGDNQVISLSYLLDHTGGETEKSVEITRLRLKTEDILNEIILLSSKLGLTLKKDETWISMSLFLYGKLPVLNGALKGSVLKAICRLYSTSNDEAPSLQNSLSGVSTICLTVTQQLSSAISPIALMHWYQWKVISQSMNHNILLGSGAFNSIKLRMWNAHKLDLGKTWNPTGNRMQLELYFDLILRDASLGGSGGCNLLRYCLRQFPDPLTESLTFAHLLFSSSETGSVLKAVTHKLLHSPLDPVNKSLESLLEDPTCVPVVGSPKTINVLKNSVSSYLKNRIWVVNDVIIESLKVREKGKEILINQLFSTHPIFPRFLSEIWSASIVGKAEACIGRLTSTSSLIQMSRTKGMFQLTQRLRQTENNTLRILSERLMEKLTDHDLTCPTQIAELMRKKGWGLILEGVTLPHPSHQWNLVPAPGGWCYRCSDDSDFLRERISLFVSSAVTRDPSAIAEPGTFFPYLGSSTSEEASTNPSSQCLEADSTVKPALRLLRTVDWLVRRDSAMHETLINLILSLTDGYERDVLGSGQQRSGSAIHRFQSSRVSSGGYPSVGFTAMTHFSFNSNDLITLGRGSDNYAILFQGVVSFYQSLLSTVITSKVSPASCYHIHYSCLSCLLKVDDILIEIRKAIIFPSSPSSLHFYVSRDKLNAWEKTRVKIPSIETESLPLSTRRLSISTLIFLTGYVRSQETLDSFLNDDLLNVSFFRKIPPEIFGQGMLIGGIILCLHASLFHKWWWSSTWGTFVSQVSYRMRRIIQDPQCFQHLTMAFLVPDYWEYCNQHSMVGGVAYPLTNKDGQITLSNWLYGLSENLSHVSSALTLMSTSRLIIYQECNTVNLVSQIASGLKISNLAYTEQLTSESLNEILLILKEMPKRIPLGSGWREYGRWTSENLHLWYSPKTVKLEVKCLPTPVRNIAVEEEFTLKTRTALAVLLNITSESNFDPPVPLQEYQYSIGSHAIRLTSRLTTSHMKVGPILGRMGVNPNLIVVAGDGSGGITSLVLRMFINCQVIFNTLIDHQDEVLQSSGTIIPPAVMLLNVNSRARLLNSHLSSCGDSDLCSSSTYKWIIEIIKQSHSLCDLWICDAETGSKDLNLKIAINTCEMLHLPQFNPSIRLLFKAHAEHMIISPVIAHLMSWWDTVSFYKSGYTCNGSLEVYCDCQGLRKTQKLVSYPLRNLSHFVRLIPLDTEFENLMQRDYQCAWLHSTENDRLRLWRSWRRLCSFAEATYRGVLTPPITLEDKLMVVFSLWWSCIHFQPEVAAKPISRNLVAKRWSIAKGIECGLSLVFKMKSHFVRSCCISDTSTHIQLKSASLFSWLKEEQRADSWSIDTRVNRHLAADSLRWSMGVLWEPKKNLFELKSIYAPLIESIAIIKFLTIMNEKLQLNDFLHDLKASCAIDDQSLTKAEQDELEYFFSMC